MSIVNRYIMNGTEIATNGAYTDGTHRSELHGAGRGSEVPRRSVLKGMAAGAGMLAAPATGNSAGTGGSASSLQDTEALRAFFDEQMEAHLSEYDVPGATVSVVADGEVRLSKGYGYADVDAGEPVRADEMLFRIGSVSKLVTTTAVMHAVERGILDLRTDVNEYLSGFQLPDTFAEPVTLEHLGTHTAGFEEKIIGLFARDAGDLPTLDEAVTEDPPERVRPPGEVAAYSNYGFGLAGHVLAEATGTAFADYVREHVFEPLGMDRSTFRQPLPDDLADATATGYTVRDDQFCGQDFEFIPMRPAAAMSATATDMARFMLAHLQGGRLGDQRILDPGTVEGMHDRRFANHPELNGMGFGFYEFDRGNVRMIAHGGRTRHFHSLLVLFPDHDVGLFVSYNGPGGEQAQEALLDAFVEEFVPPVEPAPVDPDGPPSRADDLAGTYRSTQMPETSVAKVAGVAQVVTVSVEDDGTLVTDLSGRPPQRWVEVEPLVFRAVDGHERLAFREVDGEIRYLFLGSMPMGSFERLSRWERPLVQGGIVAASMLVLLSGLVGWPAAWLLDRFGDRPLGNPPPRAAQWTAGAAIVCLFAPLVALVAAIAGDPAPLLFGTPTWLPAALALPVVGTLGLAAAAGFAAVSWRDGEGGLVWRVHYSLVVLAGFAFAAMLAYWNLLQVPV